MGGSPGVVARALQVHVSDVPLLPRSNPFHHHFIKMDPSNDAEPRGREDRGSVRGGDGLLGRGGGEQLS